jgi:hypothetical protein
MPRRTKALLPSSIVSLLSNIAKFSAALVLLCPQLPALQTSGSVRYGSEGGASAIWIFANLSFTGMRA